MSKILLAEDDTDMRRFLVKALQCASVGKLAKKPMREKSGA